VFGFKATVPIDFRVVEAECTICFLDLYSHIVFTGQQLVAKSAVLILLAYFVDFVDDGADVWSLVQENLGNQIPIWEISFS
jgi:hypothetical protein